MQLILDRLLSLEEERELPKPQSHLVPQSFENDQAIEVTELKLDDYVLELCRLIARQAKDQPLRSSYESLLDRASLWVHQENRSGEMLRNPN
ncbi:hypothetical protein HQ393_12915 [Chitinibacter bivalviorum]|uniref:Uncharacterized protein n=1 Tax=Chitinibacter bivalviorum TaxID=2739434 RepID=A0A7H9BLC1_9NEIS|nr:hypothetical protein [Chitinibacter bivalviorum]QLG89068.1 hypothetical protein HQ393_12915 [Chitinibacter bivalviorum]